MSKRTVQFVGAGPGAEDLITLRGANLLANADLVIYAGSLVNPAILKHCREECRKEDSSKLTLDEVLALIAWAVEHDQKVVRLHTGDPSMYGAIGEQIQRLQEMEIPYEVTPGISSVFASAAALACELTAPGITQSLIITRTPGRTPMPNDENIANFAQTGATLAFFLSIGKIREIMDELIELDIDETTPAAVVYRVGWPNSKIIRGTISDIAKKSDDAGITRQAIILVGKALTGPKEESLLYSSHFSHGYRNQLKKERFDGACALYAFTEKGIRKGREICNALPWATLFIPERLQHIDEDATTFPAQGFQRCVETAWQQYDAHIFMGATGIAIRTTASLLSSKKSDPALIACGESAKHCISLTGGHLGGANRLSRKIARITGGEAVITTATDENQIIAFDEMAAIERWQIENPDELTRFNAALLEGTAIDALIPEALFNEYYQHMPGVRLISSVSEITSPLVVLTANYADVPLPKESTALILSPIKFVLGVGCRRGVPFDKLKQSLEQFLAKYEIDSERIQSLASASIKEDEAGIQELATSLQIESTFIDADTLATVKTPTPSQMVKEKIGTPSVSEAAALFTSKGTLLAPKQAYGDCTFALAAIPAKKIQRVGSIKVVGLGSGALKQITPEVTEALKEADVIAGYTKYIDMIRHLTPGKQLIENGMRGEIERCRKSLEQALAGDTLCMVCSGDAGILAMAGLLYEIQGAESRFKDISIEVLPGITAASLAAAAVGAPLQNGYALLSLSNLLVPTEEILTNIVTTAQSHLTCALYNPAGKKRRDLLHQAVQIFSDLRGADTLCSLVRHAGRAEEEKWIGPLHELNLDAVDMSSLLLIGGSRVALQNGIFFERRGYGDKYGA